MNRILVVDDDRDLCALVARSVEAEGLAADCCFPAGRRWTGWAGQTTSLWCWM